MVRKCAGRQALGITDEGINEMKRGLKYSVCRQLIANIEALNRLGDESCRVRTLEATSRKSLSQSTVDETGRTSMTTR